MKKKEVQLLAILAVITGSIIALSMWSGRKPVAGTDEKDVRAEDSQSDIQTISSVELDEILGRLDRGGDKVEAQEDTLSEPKQMAKEDQGLLSDSMGTRRFSPKDDPLSSPPGESLGDKLEETQPEEIPLQEPEGEMKEIAEDASETVEYAVKKGDTLTGISLKYYNTTAKWQKILAANKDILDRAEGLRPNMRLVIPDAEHVSVSNDADDDEHSVATLSTNQQKNGKTYTVRKGDTLWSIAQKHYNDGKRYKELIDANNNLRNAKDLKVGMDISIPE